MASKGAVTVCCRIRPRVAKADMDTGADAFLYDDRSIQAKERGTNFTFDGVFGPSTSQQNIFEGVAKPLVDAALQGINVTIMCYGQTGSGKTFTMTGFPEDPGVTPRVVDSIFQRIEEAPDTMEFTIRISYLEIYMERVRDLLNPDGSNLTIRQDVMRGVFVEGAVEEYVASVEELMDIVHFGNRNRSVGTTGMNDTSSRSHSVVVITVEVRDTVTRSLQVSKLSLVDLAGSESVSRTGAEGTTLDEARMINKSLFNLAKCINALAALAETDSSGAGDSTAVAARKSMHVHIPYRDSKLTRLLQDSLGGNARTALIVCCSPCTSNVTESLSTLRFGTRAKQMKNRPVVNQVRSVEELERLLAKAEIAIDTQSAFIKALQTQIAEITGGHGGLHASDDEGPLSARSLGDHNHNVTGVSGDGEDAWGTKSSLEGGLQSSQHLGGSGNELDESTGSRRPLESPKVAGRRDSMGGISVADPAAVSQLLELSDLREEVAMLRRQREFDAEELSLRQEEIQNLSEMLRTKEDELLAAKAEADASLAATASSISQDTSATLLSSLQAFQCKICEAVPFADILDIGGVTVVHEQNCFEMQETVAALQRVEERAAVLQAEVDDLKLFISENRLQDGAKGVGHVRMERSMSAGDDGGLEIAGSNKPVVNVKVVQDLQSKLTSLIHVHRQLLRKYAVVDVECGELAEALKGRDLRISELNKASLSHNAAIRSLKQTYESKLAEVHRGHAAEIHILRKELTHSQRALQQRFASRGFKGAALLLSDESKYSTEHGLHGSDGDSVDLTNRFGTGDDADSIPAPMESPAIGRSRHVVKPLRGSHARHATAQSTGTADVDSDNDDADFQSSERLHALFCHT